jgi:hypothetical protein
VDEKSFVATIDGQKQISAYLASNPTRVDPQSVFAALLMTDAVKMDATAKKHEPPPPVVVATPRAPSVVADANTPTVIPAAPVIDAQSIVTPTPMAATPTAPKVGGRPATWRPPPTANPPVITIAKGPVLTNPSFVKPTAASISKPTPFASVPVSKTPPSNSVSKPTPYAAFSVSKTTPIAQGSLSVSKAPPSPQSAPSKPTPLGSVPVSKTPSSTSIKKPTPFGGIPRPGSSPDTRERLPSSPDTRPRSPSQVDAQEGGSVARGRADAAMKRLFESKVGKQATPRAVADKVTTDKDAKVLADQAFQSAKAHVHAGRIDAAQAAFRRAGDACNAGANAKEYPLYWTWSEFTAAEGERSLSLRLTLRDLATTAVKENPQLGFARYVLGRIALLENDEGTALKLFRFAIKLDASLTDADRYVRILLARNPEAARSKGRDQNEDDE